MKKLNKFLLGVTPPFSLSGVGNSYQTGQVLVGVLITMVFFMSLAVAVSEYSLGHFSSTKRTLGTLDALAVAEAGADNFMYNINQDTTYAGASETTLYTNDLVKGKGTYESSLVNGSVPNEKIVSITGRIYLPYNSSSPKFVRKLKLVIHGTNPTPPTLPSPFDLPTDILSGDDIDSLSMTNGASINNGRVHSNGGIFMNNLASIGTSSNFVPVSASDSTGVLNPITVRNLSHIYGDVKANSQSIGINMSNSGLIASSGVAAVAFPNYDRAGQIAAASPSVSGASAGCSTSNVTWPNNYHILGNVTVSNCTVTVMGNVWIEGKLSMQGNSILQVDASLASPPVVMVDGGVSLINNSVFAQNGAGYGFVVASYDNSANSIIFNNLSNAVGSVLFSPGGTVTFNNISGIGTRSVIAHRIHISNSVQLNLGSPGTSTWNVSYYQQDY